jgi:hypothetical protein
MHNTRLIDVLMTILCLEEVISTIRIMVTDVIWITIRDVLVMFQQWEFIDDTIWTINHWAIVFWVHNLFLNKLVACYFMSKWTSCLCNNWFKSTKPRIIFTHKITHNLKTTINSITQLKSLFWSDVLLAKMHTEEFVKWCVTRNSI